MIKFQNVVKKYKDTILLDNINFEIERNAVVCFIGKSDMGKSELFKTFADNNRIDSGIIDMGLNQDGKKNKVGVVFKDFEKNVDMTVYEYLHFYGRCFRINLSEIEIDKILYNYKLNIYKNTNVDNLSKSFKRLLSIVKVLLFNPDVLVLESPMSDINEDMKNTVRDILINLIGKMTIIFTCNNFVELGDISNYCGILENGKIIMFGTTDEVLENIQMSNNIEISVLSENDKNNALSILQNDSRVESVIIDKDKVIYSMDGSKTDEADLLKILIDNGINIYSYKKDLSSYDFTNEDIDNHINDIIIDGNDFI